MKKIISLLLLVTILISCTSCAAISNIFHPELETKYTRVLEMIQFLYVEEGVDLFEGVPRHFTVLENLLEEFPPFYLDIDEIKEECKIFKMYFKSLFDKSASYSERHDVAMTLLKKGNYNGWNFERAIFHYMSYQDILEVVLFGEWGSSYSFYFSEKDDNDIWLYTNLPNDKESGVTYFFFIDNRVIGYESADGNSVKFNAYRIVDISFNEVKIYCFSNNKYYTLENNSK